MTDTTAITKQELEQALLASAKECADAARAFAASRINYADKAKALAESAAAMTDAWRQIAR